MVTSVYIVTKEEIICVFDISVGWLLGWCSESVEETIYIVDLAMQIAKNFDRCSQLDKIKITLTKAGYSSSAFSTYSSNLLMY
jgi:hypothetical protein